jgi:signal transduction histidine kinase
VSLPPSLKQPSIRKLWLLRLARVLLASFFGFLLTHVNLNYIEAWLYDFRVQARPDRPPKAPIKLILVKPETIAALKGPPKFEHYVQLLEHLSEERAKYVVLSMKLEDIEGTEKDKLRFVEATRKLSHFFVTTNELEMKGELGKTRLPPPFDSVPVASAPKTQDTNILAKDGVTRRMLVSAYEDQPMLHTRIASDLNPQVKDVRNIRGQIDLFETKQVYINFKPIHTFPEFSFERVLSGSFEKGTFQDQVVVVGLDYRRSFQDYIMTPYNREAVLSMSIAEMHANMIDTLVENSAPIKAPEWFNLIITILISILTVHVVLTVRPSTGLLMMGATLFGYSFLAWLSFWPLGIWINMAHPVMAVFLCYYFFIPYRLIIENRRSWEYYQKNKLLKQVEELKTNFISMMSHDLKTPLARIQGMTDLILSDSLKISSQQREAIDTIRQSSDDLLKFISKILNYGKIESQGIELHLQSKDVNTLIAEVIKKHEFLAKLKRVQITQELEPLFPILVDADLMKQVFSNLIENAIKYSPEDTKVLISSEEIGSKVVVQVADQGPGIPSDELPNIFMKFFRSKNAKSSPIKGSGLGLYLAKYFTELHQGSLFVESTYGQGSTFTVELPLARDSV